MAKKTTNEPNTDPVEQAAQPAEETQNAQQGQQESAAEEEVIQLTRAEFETVKTHIESLQKERDEAVGLAQRLQADFDNYRKRNATLRADSYEEGTRDCIKALLPTLDSFDRALSSAAGVDPCFAEGVRLVQRMLTDTLGKLGLQEVPAEGAFDPNLHNAVMQEAAEGKATGDILEVLQKGYEINGRVLRHSMVKVAE